MNEMQIFSKPEFGRIGALTADDGTPWFNAVDVCKALGYKNVTDALKKHVDEPDLAKCETRSGGQVRKVNFVNESGLYSLILSPKLPNAQAFKRWVTSEVLPALRKHGVYLTQEAMDKTLKDPKFLETALSQLRAERDKNTIAEWFHHSSVLLRLSAARRSTPKVLNKNSRRSDRASGRNLRFRRERGSTPEVLNRNSRR